MFNVDMTRLREKILFLILLVRLDKLCPFDSRYRGWSTGEIHFPHYVSVSCHRSLGDLRAVRRAGRKGGSHGSIDTVIIALLSPWTWIATVTLTPNRSSRYKTLSCIFFSAPKKELSREIRKIALEGAKPDSYMRTLLTVLRVVDNYYSFDDPFLER